MLIQIGHSATIPILYRYAYIDESTMYTFDFPEKVIQYDSPMGNNTVPYPVARTANFYLFMLDHRWIYKKDFVSACLKWKPTEEDSNRRVPESLEKDLYLFYYKIKDSVPHTFRQGTFPHLRFIVEIP